MRKQRFTIPVFVPEAACPNRCVFCNQHHISAAQSAPSARQVIEAIETRLATIPAGSFTGIGFFGGNFTGISHQLQKKYLEIVQPYLAAGRIQEIRISTRPDYISNESLSLLKSYGVAAIELGAQSLDDEVLSLSGRGHTRRQVEDSSRMINEAGFELGLQMMIGLPGDTPGKSIATAEKIIQLGARTTRIYPTLVIRDTDLAEWYKEGRYIPLSLTDAVNRAADIVPLFAEAGVTILRIGLHPSEGLLNGSNLLAGPFHVALGEMVYGEIWRRIFLNMMELETHSGTIEITVPEGQRNAATGHRASNKKMLLQQYRKLIIYESDQLKPFRCHAVYH